MKLLYVTTARIPTEKANGVQIIKMCEAFQRQGLQVELLVPFRFQSRAMKAVKNIWEYYDVEIPFRIRHIFCPDFIRLEHILPLKVVRCLYYLQYFFFAFLALGRTLFQSQGVYYSRSLQPLLLLCLTKPLHRKRIYFEAHELHGDRKRMGVLRKINSAIMRWMLRQIDGLIVITSRLKTLYAAMGVQEDDIFVAPDGIDAKRLSQELDRSAARQKLQVSLDKNMICYTGHLFKWKGVYTLTESTRYLPDNYVIYIVGGMDADIDTLRQFVLEQELKNVMIMGHIPYTMVPFYLSAADVLALPNSAQAKISREYTSPLKLFEYMGARRPIVASDLPSLREVLRHKENAYLVRPDEPEMLADGIQRVIHDRELAQQMTDTAYTEVQEYTWDTRARKILTFLHCGDNDC